MQIQTCSEHILSNITCLERRPLMQRDYQIIAVDFDGTLCFSNWPELGEPNYTLISYLKKWKSNGNKLILWTCRANEALEKAVDWCQQQGLEFDAINDNLPEIVEYYGNNSRKITSDWYIDDRMMPILTPSLACHKMNNVDIL